jgi:hypothetical protein
VPSVQRPRSFSRAVAEVFAAEVMRHRPTGDEALARIAVAFAVAGEDGWDTATAVITDKVDVVSGDVKPPGIAWVRVTASEDALRTLFGGRGDAQALVLLGEIKVEGDVFLLSDVAACFGKSDIALAERLRRE